MLKSPHPPIYEVEFIPIERRLNERRATASDTAGYLADTNRRRSPGRRSGDVLQARQAPALPKIAK